MLHKIRTGVGMFWGLDGLAALFVTVVKQAACPLIPDACYY